MADRFSDADAVLRESPRPAAADQPLRISRTRSATVKAARRLARQLVKEQLKDTQSGGYQRQHRRIYHWPSRAQLIPGLTCVGGAGTSTPVGIGGFSRDGLPRLPQHK